MAGKSDRFPVVQKQIAVHEVFAHAGIVFAGLTGIIMGILIRNVCPVENSVGVRPQVFLDEQVPVILVCISGGVNVVSCVH